MINIHEASAILGDSQSSPSLVVQSFATSLFAARAAVVVLRLFPSLTHPYLGSATGSLVFPYPFLDGKVARLNSSVQDPVQVLVTLVAVSLPSVCT